MLKFIQPEDLKTRLIISGPESPTQRLSCLVENLLKPIVPCLTTYVKDDWDFLPFLPCSLNFDSALYSCDIESLYTSNPIDLGIEAIDYWITRLASSLFLFFCSVSILSCYSLISGRERG